MPDVSSSQELSIIPDDLTCILKQGRTFVMCDCLGDIVLSGPGNQGLYHADTRFLSLWTLRLGPQRPIRLSSGVSANNQLLTVHMTNPEIHTITHHTSRAAAVLPPHSLHLIRTCLLWQDIWYETLTVTNYHLHVCTVPLTFHAASDFADLFEVRGHPRIQRGQRYREQTEIHQVCLGYQGLDGVPRRTVLAFDPDPPLPRWEQGSGKVDYSAHFQLTLTPRESVTLLLTIACETGRSTPADVSFYTAHSAALAAHQDSTMRSCGIITSHTHFNAWLERSTRDLQMLLTERDGVLYPDAGIPWFCTPFGRDGIITALATLWCNPQIARGVLIYLAATQASDTILEQEAEPGKIIHEIRAGELTATGELPFGRYYGSVDATPLFVLLAGAYYQRTGDHALINAIWPNIERALAWIDTYRQISQRLYNK